MNLRASLSMALFTVLLALPAVPAHAAGVGLVKTAKGEVFIERQGRRIAVTVGTQVEVADVVRTGSNGSAGITFLDNSRMALGPKSTLEINRFAFNQTTHEGNFGSTLKRGTLSAVSGKLAKHSPKAMTVGTRSTILAVRGTEFVVRSR